MKIRSFEFNLRELAGSMGDFGTLFPLAIGYIAVCGLNQAGLLVMMGVANIATGLIYGLPMPIEPMKVLAVVAIAQHWSPSLIYASGFAMGLIWLLFAVTGIIDRIVKITPQSVIRGIQVALGVLLAFQALKLVTMGWVLGIFAILVVLVLRQNRYAPAAVVLMLLGVGIMLVKGEFGGVASPGFTLPSLTGFHIGEVWQGLMRAGFAQIPLTATNAVIATAALIVTYWPDKPVVERRLALNTGIMNLVMPFFGGMPFCHGAGGLAAQYYFGARTGGGEYYGGADGDRHGIIPDHIHCRTLCRLSHSYNWGYALYGWDRTDPVRQRCPLGQRGNPLDRNRHCCLGQQHGFRISGRACSPLSVAGMATPVE